MKIDRETLHLPPLKNDAVDSAAADAVLPRTGSQPSPTGDQLKLSPDVEIARGAIQQAATLPEIRHELVDRVRKLLEQGEVGTDSERLADAMIDSLVDQSVDDEE